MKIETCLHCGVRVMFQSDGRCPACTEHRDAPITDTHVARIVEQAHEPQRRAAARASNLLSARKNDVLIGAACVASGVLLVAATFEAPESPGVFVPTGVLVYGLGRLVRGLLAGEAGPPEE